MLPVLPVLAALPVLRLLAQPTENRAFSGGGGGLLLLHLLQVRPFAYFAFVVVGLALYLQLKLAL